jgi:hypothetical protein
VHVARRPRGLPALVTVTLLAYGWWVTELRPFTWPALLAVEGAGVAAVTVAAGRSRPPAAAPAGKAAGKAAGAPPGWRAGLAVWVAVVVLLAGWELAAYVQHPRADHPTISLLLDRALAAQPVRAAAVAGWLAGAYGLARR